MRTHEPVLCTLVTALVLALPGCGEKQDLEEWVAAARAQYTVQLVYFTAEEPHAEIEEAAATEESGEVAMAAEAVESATAGEAAEGEETAEEFEEPIEESGPRPTNVILHLLVRFDGDEPLPGVTVEVTQADPFGQEKEPTLHWIETASMSKSDVQQVDLRLEGVEYEDGDAFSVLLRENVPAEDRSEYREFAEAAP